MTACYGNGLAPGPRGPVPDGATEHVRRLFSTFRWAPTSRTRLSRGTNHDTTTARAADREKSLSVCLSFFLSLKRRN